MTATQLPSQCHISHRDALLSKQGMKRQVHLAHDVFHPPHPTSSVERTESITISFSALLGSHCENSSFQSCSASRSRAVLWLVFEPFCVSSEHSASKKFEMSNNEVDVTV